MYQAHFFRWAY